MDKALPVMDGLLVFLVKMANPTQVAEFIKKRSSPEWIFSHMGHEKIWESALPLINIYMP